MEFTCHVYVVRSIWNQPLGRRCQKRDNHKYASLRAYKRLSASGNDGLGQKTEAFLEVAIQGSISPTLFLLVTEIDKLKTREKFRRLTQHLVIFRHTSYDNFVP
jgi:hypothetical protein